ncbi:hypothetical protein [Leptolyngbya sp. FACHB-8]|nr:hypothetical protein [Leptolyngbya sp. FACHB-8]
MISSAIAPDLLKYWAKTSLKQHWPQSNSPELAWNAIVIFP